MPIEGSPTVGALYYQYKNFNLKQGLIEQNIAETDLQMHNKIGSKIDETGLAELQENFLQEITGKLEKLWQFQFSADPFKTLICQKCEWSRLCRAPHLM